MINQIIAYVVISLGLFFMILGTFGLYRFKSFYSRILITSKIETVGFITVMTGVILYSGFTFFSLKTVLVIALYLTTNPLSTHAIGHSAFAGGLKIEDIIDD